MIREAVGAIIIKDDKFLLIHKTKINTSNGKEDIDGEWDFVKGKIEEYDNSKEDAILRELKEETGSDNYKILKKYNRDIKFNFNSEISKRINYSSQITTIFLVEYLGDNSDLTPVDNEIDMISFFTESELLKKLSHIETKDFYIENYRK